MLDGVTEALTVVVVVKDELRSDVLACKPALESDWLAAASLADWFVLLDDATSIFLLDDETL